MEHPKWVSVARYVNVDQATVDAGRLEGQGIRSHVDIPAGPPLGWVFSGLVECYVQVLPEDAEKAKQILAEPAVAEDELIREALKYPPPDDL